MSRSISLQSFKARNDEFVERMVREMCRQSPLHARFEFEREQTRKAVQAYWHAYRAVYRRETR